MQKKWFKAKSYGWGWTPASWEGWLVITIFSVLLAYFLYTVHLEKQPSSEDIFNLVVKVGGLTILMIIICYLTGEEPHWQWGKPKS